LHGWKTGPVCAREEDEWSALDDKVLVITNRICIRGKGRLSALETRMAELHTVFSTSVVLFGDYHANKTGKIEIKSSVSYMYFNIFCALNY
jgi:hypothetical protein